MRYPKTSLACAVRGELGQSMVEYLVVLLAVVVILLAPIPSIVPGKLPDKASVLTQLSVALRGAYADYSWAAAQPIVQPVVGPN